MATTVTEEWTEESCIQLIREFRSRPELWNPKSPFYFKRKRKEAAWAAIGEVINRKPSKCKHKMGVLMSSFRREKARIINSIQDGDPSKFHKSNWFGFKEMTFLTDKEGERIKRLMVGSINEETVPTSTPPFKNQLVQPAPPKLATPSTDNDYEIQAFTNFIASKMKKYSEATKNAVQQAICQIIFKADQRCIENANCDSPSTSQRVVWDGNEDIIETSFVKEENEVFGPEEIVIEQE